MRTPAAAAAKSPQPRWRKRAANWSRWLHLYLSMLSFLVVLFFAATGLTLNHAEWFDGQSRERQASGTVPVAWVNVPDTARIQKLQVAERLRRQYHVQGYVSDFRVEDAQCAVSFRGPGYSADATINRLDGTFQLSEQRLGLVAVLNDLHKGRDSGPGWSWLLDASAVFLVLVSLSGLVMLLFLKNKRLNGLLVGLVGGVLCYFVYWLWVP